ELLLRQLRQFERQGHLLPAGRGDRPAHRLHVLTLGDGSQRRIVSSAGRKGPGAGNGRGHLYLRLLVLLPGAIDADGVRAAVERSGRPDALVLGLIAEGVVVGIRFDIGVEKQLKGDRRRSLARPGRLSVFESRAPAENGERSGGLGEEIRKAGATVE